MFEVNHHLLFIKKKVLKCRSLQDVVNRSLYGAPEHARGTIG